MRSFGLFLSLLFLIILQSFTFIGQVNGKRHTLKIENDRRRKISITTYGFLKKGYLVFNLTDFSMRDGMQLNNFTRKVQFTLDKMNSLGVAAYSDTDSGKDCDSAASSSATSEPKADDHGATVVVFRINFPKDRIDIQRKGNDFQNLTIITQFESEFNSQRTKRSKRQAVGDEPRAQNSTEVISRISSISTTSPASKIPSSSPTLPTVPMSSPTLPTVPMSSPTLPTVPMRSPTLPTVPMSDSDLIQSIRITSVKLDKMYLYSAYFMVDVKRDYEEGLYKLSFHNCEEEPVNFTLTLVEKNDGNYLSAGDIPLPWLYCIFSLVYVGIFGFWIYVLKTSKDNVFKTHYLMLVLVLVKAISLLFHGINNYFLAEQGLHKEAFAILWYIAYLMRGTLLFVTILLVGVGWAFVKHVLSDRDKKIFVIVIPLQILANIAQIIVEQTEEGQADYSTWKNIFILVDLLCCGAILFPVVWSIRHLQEASQTDGKAAINLVKLKIFRHFYILIVCYIYFTRIIVILLEITLPFQYLWLRELFNEGAVLTFYLVAGYKFRPASNNPYLKLSTDSDDEVEMDEVVTPLGVYDGITKVNVKIKDGNTESDGPKQREASLEYD